MPVSIMNEKLCYTRKDKAFDFSKPENNLLGLTFRAGCFFARTTHKNGEGNRRLPPLMSMQEQLDASLSFAAIACDLTLNH
jgi:hypothetical protein